MTDLNECEKILSLIYKQNAKLLAQNKALVLWMAFFAGTLATLLVGFNLYMAYSNAI